MSRNFDIAIIGSGMGGLVAANVLSKKGFKVAVLERNKYAGGCLHSFEKDGVVFDTGIHYVGSLEEGQVLNQVFKYLKLIPGLDIRKMDENGFDKIRIGNKEYSYGMGYRNFKEQLISQFPKESVAINQYVSKITEIVDSISLYNLKEFTFDINNIYDKFDFGNAWDYIKSVTQNKELQQVLSGINSLYAGSRENSFLYVHALINNHYIESSWRFVDGSKQVADILVDNLRANGGEIFLEKEVVKLQGSKSGIQFAETADKDKFFAKNFISAVHPYLTLEMLDGDIVRKSFANRIRNMRNTVSAFTLFLTFKDGEVPYMNHNLRYYPTGDVWGLSYYNADKFPQDFGLFPVADSIDEKYTRSASAISFMEYDEMKEWENTSIEERGSSYENFKEEKSQKMIALLEEAMPGISSSIKSYSAGTPLTLRDYTATHKGSIYGILRDSGNPNESILFPQTKVPNLFMAGQSLSLHGMLGTTMSAILTSGMFCNLNELIREINNA